MEREKQEAWELAKQLVQIDSSDPGAERTIHAVFFNKLFFLMYVRLPFLKN